MASSSPLPELAFITLECTILPFLLCAWTNSLTLSVLPVLFFEIVIREGFSVNSPFPYVDPTDEFQGRRIMNAIYPIYIIAFGLLAKLLILLLKFPTMFKLSVLLPNSFFKRTGKAHYSKLFLFVSLVWLLFISLGTYVTYKVLLDNSQPLVAVIWMNLFPLFVFLFAYVLFRYWKSLFKSFEKVIEDSHENSTITKTKTAQLMLILIIVTIGVSVLFGNFIISLILYFRNDVNWTALSAPAVWVVILIFIIIMRFITGAVMRKYGGISKKEKLLEKEKEEERRAEETLTRPSLQNYT